MSTGHTDGNSAITTLCWNCSREIAYYDKTCPYCWVTNGNVDLGKALKEALSDETLAKE